MSFYICSSSFKAVQLKEEVDGYRKLLIGDGVNVRVGKASGTEPVFYRHAVAMFVSPALEAAVHSRLLSRGGVPKETQQQPVELRWTLL
jgi:hypothetical protein